MKIKTSELIGPYLNWAVAKCEGIKRPYIHNGFCKYGLDFCRNEVFLIEVFLMYSTDWACGGRIIERECMDILCLAGGDDGWQADKYLPTEKVEGYGPTPLIAAMRCYVASKLGDEVDVPDEILSK